jgi:hypothetical protein
MTILDAYWPSLANVGGCIRTEAEAVDDAVLLAVHEPGPMRVRSATGASEVGATEQDLLEALLRPADDGSAVLVAITGDSGVGKSHMIRWLHAQLQRHAKRAQLVIVLIPKTASLRQVVERILEPLQGREYQKLKAELSKAVEMLTPEAASQMLATALAIELEQKFEETMKVLRGGGNTADRQLRDRAAHARGLRHIMRDSAVFDVWMGNVLKRIVKQTIEGGSEVQRGELRRFTPDDLEVPENWDPSRATRAANQFLQQLSMNNGAARPLAADVLQDALDPALRVVFRFSEALGQRTIEEIVDDIRRSLLAEGKELVLLIEDFAALAGIQQPLLSLMIAESDHQGKRVRAPLRTALAVTDGFLPSRQTILTRAKQEWIIPNTARTEEEIVQRFIELAGRYLNAARWGVEALREQFLRRVGVDLDGWVERYRSPVSAEEEDMLSAFGRSRRGYPLFPLSAESIESMCQRELRSGNQLVFNPRMFINGVLNDTLLKRPMHEKGAFPPAGFKEAVMAAGVDVALRARAVPQSVKDRLAPVLVHWAKNPSDLGGPPHVAKGVFEAFGLPFPFQDQQNAASPPPTPPKEAKVVAAKGTAPTPAVGPHSRPGTPGFDEQVEAWANGNLAQKPANYVRQIVAAALNERMDWNGLRMRATPIAAGHIWLPFALVGNPTTEPRFAVSEESRPLSPMLRAGVQALDRWQASGRNWDYVGAEDDYATAQHLLDGLEGQAIDWLARAAQRQAAVAVRVLHRQALVLRVTQRAEPTSPRLGEYFVELSPVAVPDGSDRSPAALVQAAVSSAALTMPHVRRVLLDAIGCFQGIGAQTHAVDAERLHKAWKSEENEDDPQQIKPEFREAREAANQFARSRVEVLLARYRAAAEVMLPVIEAMVGADAESNIATPVRALVSRVQKAGLFSSGEVSGADVDRALNLLATEETRRALQRAVSFTAPDASRSIDFQLAGWAAIDIATLEAAFKALALLDKLLHAIQRAARAELQASGGADVAAAVQKLQDDLGAVISETSS